MKQRGVWSMLLVVSGWLSCVMYVSAQNGLRPSPINPFYWEYDGELVVLLGSSWEDNIFNHTTGLQGHLDNLKNAGGNYIRNVMSNNEPDMGNIFPYFKRTDGKYDLDQWNGAYWTRLDDLIKMCHDRGIIVQMELWCAFDYFVSDPHQTGRIGWESQPFNPKNNVNYTAASSGLPETIGYTTNEPGRHPFLKTVPELSNNTVVLPYQKALVNRILDVTLKYNNVLYCMNNESKESVKWGQYWGDFVRARAVKDGKTVMLADMRQNPDFNSTEQVNLMNDTRFDFFEISQNNVKVDQAHMDVIKTVRDRFLSKPRPLSNTKIYGGTVAWTTSEEEGTRRFWRDIFGGCASARFHRPAFNASNQNHGIGGTTLSYTHIRSLRMVLNDIGMDENVRPHTDDTIAGLLGSRSSNEAYIMAHPGRVYAVYFVNGGSVTLNTSAVAGSMTLRWLQVSNSTWQTASTVSGSSLTLTAPGSGQWVAVVKIATASAICGPVLSASLADFASDTAVLRWDSAEGFTYSVHHSVDMRVSRRVRPDPADRENRKQPCLI